MEKKIRISSKKISSDPKGVIKITPAAYMALGEVVAKTGKSIREVASEIILQAIEKDLIEYEREV